ncbi:Translocation protein SEC62 [Neolecta irregularis DAH-3]|uniref:Translocation protein SEC62 n=1 Tax=Neolecta irregularis (strain DAH-3) TaxID=1198029 RepID=A0A1U7LRM9_NEOID|nr:Translocation protein SEC62 [Neolecta irregularis DAH-3]|eukprot:OLL25326.1 Translocation protein SEC62 [Neolecta irregularis DAH-3]
MNDQAPAAPNPELLAVSKYLRNHAVVKSQAGVLDNKRVEFFKVKHALKALQSEEYKKKRKAIMPQIATRDDAVKVLSQLPRAGFVLRVTKLSKEEAIKVRGGKKGKKGDPKLLRLEQVQEFGDDCYYVWLFQGSQLMAILASLGLVIVAFTAVLFPLWPQSLRIGVWYLSMGMLGLLGLFFVIAIIRLILYLVTIFTHPPGLWLYPNLFADVGVIDSFRPLYAWDKPKKKKEQKSKNTGKSGKEEGSAKSTAVKSEANAVARDLKTKIEDVEG